MNGLADAQLGLGPVEVGDDFPFRIGVDDSRQGEQPERVFQVLQGIRRNDDHNFFFARILVQMEPLTLIFSHGQPDFGFCRNRVPLRVEIGIREHPKDFAR